MAADGGALCGRGGDGEWGAGAAVWGEASAAGAAQL